MKQYNIAVVGATGMVGRKFLQVLEERIGDGILVAGFLHLRQLSEQLLVLDIGDPCFKELMYVSHCFEPFPCRYETLVHPAFTRGGTANARITSDNTPSR